MLGTTGHGDKTAPDTVNEGMRACMVRQPLRGLALRVRGRDGDGFRMRLLTNLVSVFSFAVDG